MNKNIFVPVLFIAFNRPDVTEITFNYIRKAKPRKLFIAIDGARANKVGEDELVDEVKSITRKVDWVCEVKYKINETNLGAEITVSSAISWVLESEEYVIILEDDIIAPLSFFEFAQEMLLKFKDNEKISTISGNNFTPFHVKNNEDYFFSKYGHSWGWATWRRFWKDFDLNIEIQDKYLLEEFLNKITNSKKESIYYKELFKKLKNNGKGNSTWDFVALFLHRINECLSIVPKHNLTSNIGVYGLHAKGARDVHFLPIDYHFKAFTHPPVIECFTEYDIYHFSKYISPKNFVYRRFKNFKSRIIGYIRYNQFMKDKAIKQL